MSNIVETAVISKEDCARAYQDHFAQHNQGYYKILDKYNNDLKSLVGGSSFSREAYQKILTNDGLWRKSVESAADIFRGDAAKQKEFRRLMDNSREVAIQRDINGYGLEGWGGGNAVYASSIGAFAMGTTPFIIGGWLAGARSEEIFQHIDNQNKERLEFEYNVDYLQVGNSKFYFPQAFRNGEIVGYNKLPKIDWVTPNTNAGAYTAPESWCGEDMFIMMNPTSSATSSFAQGNLLEVSKYNKHKYGVEPNFVLTAIKYKDGATVKTKRIHLHYDVATGPTNERILKSRFYLNKVGGSSASILVQIVFQVNLDTGDFTFFSHAGDDAATNAIVLGYQFSGKVSNIANEMTNIPTMGVEKFEFIRECEYRQYSKVSLNEYMADNFRIGATNQIQYAAYATDKNLQYTLFNRELEAEQYLMDEVLADGVDLDSFELSRKLGGFINNELSFTINRFVPGMHLQDYKEGLKTYLMKVLSTAETDIHIPASVNKQWIFLGYDATITEIPEIKFENKAVELNSKDEGARENENYGFSVDTKCAFSDSLGRSARFIANNDGRWRDRGSRLFGAIRTFSMEYPFLVYYPHAIRMFTAIDADNPNRTAIVIGGREFRGHFAAGAVEMEINGVFDDAGKIVNNFDAQVVNAKTGYEVRNTPVTAE